MRPREAARGAAGLVLRSVARLSSRRAGAVLVYHGIGTEGSEFAVSSGAFEREMRHLRRHYRPVAAGEIREAARRRRRGERFPVAITLDDDLPSHVEEALPALRRAGVSATFFLGGANGFGRDNVETLRRAGFEIGFHTVRHRPLPSLSDADLEQDLREGRADLVQPAGQLDLIAYPHGKADARVAEAARSEGFALGFTTQEALVGPETDPHLIPRIVPAASSGAFALQLARAFAGR